jgi:hypothetical protein
VNLPWITYGGDFGANAWSPGGGLSRGERAVELDRVLGRLAAHGVHAVRWFLLCDARAGVRVDAAGRPAGIDDALRRDLDTALARLDRHGVRALFVLFDFLLLRRARVHQRVQMFGRRRWVANAEARARLLDLVVGPVVAHVRDADAVMGWDLMNEPEWVTMGEGGRVPWHCVSRSTMRGFLAEAARTVREAGPQPVTVGLASLRGLDLVGGLGLDFYQVHWYDHVDAPSALVTPAAAHGLDRPLVLGEFPTLQSGQRPLNVLAAVAHAGYAGAFAWSYCAEDQFSSAAVCDDEVAGWQPPRP